MSARWGTSEEEAWKKLALKHLEYVQQAHPSAKGEAAVEAGLELTAMARCLSGVACKRCRGKGSQTYGSTATWMGGVGGQAFTEGVCDECWGTGRADRKGPNLKAIRGESG